MSRYRGIWVSFTKVDISLILCIILVSFTTLACYYMVWVAYAVYFLDLDTNSSIRSIPHLLH